MAHPKGLVVGSALIAASHSELLGYWSSYKSTQLKQYAVGGFLFGTGLLSVLINAPLLGVAFCALGAYKISTGYWESRIYSTQPIN